MNTFVRSIIATLLIVGFSFSAQAQDYRYHSVFLYNFSKYIEWPDSYATGDFVIGILGNSPLQVHLEKMAASKSVGNQRFAIKVFNSPAEVGKCHMLFIPKDNSGMLSTVADKLKNQATVIITEEEGLATQGAIINFVRKDGKWVFELNEDAAVKNNLRVSQSLSKLAIRV